jgi:hypothetical protein
MSFVSVLGVVKLAWNDNQVGEEIISFQKATNHSLRLSSQV